MDRDQPARRDDPTDRIVKGETVAERLSGAGPIVRRKVFLAQVGCNTAGATLRLVPTKHPRHAVTETPRVERVLRKLRSAQPDRRIDFQELVILGAEEKLRRLRQAPDRSGLMESFLELRDGDGIDARVGLDHHHGGWSHSA